MASAAAAAKDANIRLSWDMLCPEWALAQENMAAMEDGSMMGNIPLISPLLRGAAAVGTGMGVAVGLVEDRGPEGPGGRPMSIDGRERGHGRRYGEA